MAGMNELGRATESVREPSLAPPKQSLDPPHRQRPVCGDPGDGAPTSVQIDLTTR